MWNAFLNKLYFQIFKDPVGYQEQQTRRKQQLPILNNFVKQTRRKPLFLLKILKRNARFSNFETSWTEIFFAIFPNNPQFKSTMLLNCFDLEMENNKFVIKCFKFYYEISNLQMKKKFSLRERDWDRIWRRNEEWTFWWRFCVNWRLLLLGRRRWKWWKSCSGFTVRSFHW